MIMTMINQNLGFLLHSTLQYPQLAMIYLLMHASHNHRYGCRGLCYSFTLGVLLEIIMYLARICSVRSLCALQLVHIRK